MSPQTCKEVGKRHVLDYAEHFGREEHEFGHGVRSHHQACGVPLAQIDDDVFRSGGFTHLGGVTPRYRRSSLLVQQGLLVDVHTEAFAARITEPVLQISPVA